MILSSGGLGIMILISEGLGGRDDRLRYNDSYCARIKDGDINPFIS